MDPEVGHGVGTLVENILLSGYKVSLEILVRTPLKKQLDPRSSVKKNKKNCQVGHPLTKFSRSPHDMPPTSHIAFCLFVMTMINLFIQLSNNEH